MSYQVITPADLGNGLKVEENKVVVDVAALNIPVDIKLAGVDVDVAGKKMTFELSDGSRIERDVSDFLVADTDTKVTGGSVAGNTLTLTLSEGVPVEIDLSPLLTAVDGKIDAKVNPVDTRLATAEGKLAEAERKIAELEARKPTGTEVVSLGGTSLGYLVSAADVNVA